MGPSPAIDLDELGRRAAALGLKQKEFAALGGIGPTHLWQILNKNVRPLTTTRDRLVAGLVGAERAQLARLAKLYPDDVIQLANVALCPARGGEAA